MNIRRWLMTLAACVLLLAGLAGYKFFQIRAAVAFANSLPEPSASVRALTVAASVAQEHVTTIGEVVAPEALELRNELEGRVTEVNMASGGRVRKGEVLLRMDVSEESARIQAARASVAIAGLNLRRLETLLKRNTVSQDRVDQARAEFDVASARVSELQATIDKKTLKAPFDAVLGLNHIEVGQYLNSNTALAWMVGIRDELWVDFSLPLAQGSVDVGDTVRVTRTSGDDRERAATVIAVDPAVSPQSRNRRYRARMAADPVLPPNSVINVSVRSEERRQIQVPAPAVLRDEMGPYVFVLEPEKNGGYRARRQSVTLGAENAESVSVLKGLDPGQMIATDGTFKLHNGMLAFIRERPSASTSAGNSK